MSRNLRLVACLLNISEARCRSVVNAVVKAATEGQQNWTHDDEAACSRSFKCNATVLNVFSDHDYNRSVISIAAPAEFIARSVLQACVAAYELIDIRAHNGGHPRLGSVDLVPIHPLSPSVGLAECGAIAREIGQGIAERFPNACVFYFGAADRGLQRGLVARRKEVDWYGKRTGDKDEAGYDIGNRPSSHNGVTGIGAIPYMMNLNVTLEGSDIHAGRDIASRIRATTAATGLAGVQAMAFPHEGNIEVACNLETRDMQEHNDIFYTTPATLESAIRQLAAQKSISVLHDTLIGFTPHVAYEKAESALMEGRTLALPTAETCLM